MVSVISNTVAINYQMQNLGGCSCRGMNLNICETSVPESVVCVPLTWEEAVGRIRCSLP